MKKNLSILKLKKIIIVSDIDDIGILIFYSYKNALR